MSRGSGESYNSYIIKLEAMEQQLEKFRQETEYVCLKLAVKDWNTLLAEVRQGNIVTKPKNNPPSTLNSLLAELRDNPSSQRQQHQHSNKKYCQCESSVCLEQPIPKTQGGSSLSSSRCSSTPNNSNKHADPFQQYKIEQLWGQAPTMNQSALQEILKSIDKEQQESFNGFETFRKNGNLVESFGGEKEREQSEWREGQGRAGPDRQMSGECSMKELMLALQNTKLRKQIRHFQEILAGS